MDVTIAQNDSPTSDSQPNKRRRKKSMVWDHFTIETVNADCVRASCNQCKKSFAYITGSKLAGTSHLKRHIALGICPVGRHNQDNNDQSSPDMPLSTTNISVNGTNRPRRRFRPSNAVASIYREGDNLSNSFAKMIIQHDYPLHISELPEFINLAKNLSPQFGMTNVGLVEEQIMGVYFKEKRKLLELASRIPGRLSLTMDLWTSNRSLTYLLLTGHFTDHDWKLQRRILNFVEVPFPDSDTAFSHAVTTCLTDWSSEGKLFTFTLDRSHVNDKARGNIRSLLSIKSSLILNGQLLINSCYVCALSSLAQEALSSMKETVQKVRNSVKHVKTSKVHEERFTKLKEKLQVPCTKNLTIDDLTKWNSTYLMLVAACELKEVFSCLDTFDPDYKSTPSMEEWEKVEKLCTYLNKFYDAASILTLPIYPTSNIFFHEAWKIQSDLMQGAVNPDLFERNLTYPLLNLFTKYWEDCNLILAVAVVMDPRFKMQLVQFGFSRIYGEETNTWLKIVDEGLHELYLEYVVQSLPAPTFLEEEEETDVMLKTELSQDDTLLDDGEPGFSDFDIYICDIISGQQMKSELDQYLEEPLLPRMQDFDVLGWWKVNEPKYPTLSRMACDVLSIPLSTLPMESVFDTRERKVDNNRSLLRGKTLEALVCAKDWLRYDSLRVGAEIANGIVKAEL